MWRGLMLNRGVQHFLQDVDWGDDLDYLLVDMPPGTGDVQMGVAKLVPRAEVIIVTTPALAAQKVAVRAASMAQKNFLRIAGVIENMSAFTCEHGSSYALFGEGGGEACAREAGAPLLGSVPLEPLVASGGDAGEPVALGDGPAAEAFRAIAARIVEEAVPPMEMAGAAPACSRPRSPRSTGRRGDVEAPNPSDHFLKRDTSVLLLTTEKVVVLLLVVLNIRCFFFSTFSFPPPFSLLVLKNPET